ncbi:MAG: hypothetical protein WB661_07475 [Candidatus Bathyarchaeia archaeon]
MLAPLWFFGFDSLMEFIAFAIASAVAYQALKGYRLSKERTLLYLNLSFGLLGAGLLIDGLANLVVLLARFHRAFLFLSAFGYTINFLAQLLAYGLLVFAYMQQARNVGGQVAMAAAVPALFFEHNAITELILIFLLVYIATNTAINYNMNKSTSALLVFGAFASLSVAHIFFLLFTIAPIFFPFAHIAQLFGFLLLLAMLLRVNHAA